MANQPLLDWKKIAPVIALLIVLAVVYLVRQGCNQSHTGSTAAAGPGEYLLCTWNLENFFDDHHDQRNRIDAEYDSWFADKPEDFQLKLKHITEALLRMNGGKGPDILVGVEVETKRAAELLAESLNKALPEGAPKYTTVVMKEINAGRHIAPAVISRLPVSREHEPRLLAPQRILVVNLSAGGHDLIVFATHWTSHRSDEEGAKREKYADLVYGRANEVFHANPKADILVCGDFNDTPGDPAVRDHLHTGNIDEVRGAKDLRFLNLMAGKDANRYGTHYYNKPLIYDQICVSPGLLDGEGWSCEVDSIQTVTEGLLMPGSRIRKPWRFGNRKDTHERGYSDHFPVTVKLRVGAENPK